MSHIGHMRSNIRMELAHRTVRYDHTARMPFHRMPFHVQSTSRLTYEVTSCLTLAEQRHD